jgi:CBS domain-containing protein
MSLRVRDVMTSDPSTVTPETLLTDVAEEIIQQRYSGVPVVDDKEVVGLVEVGDLLPHPEQVPFSQVDALEFQGEWVDEDRLEAYYDVLQRLRVEAVMRTDPTTVEPGARLGEIIRKLLEDDVRRLLVTDEDDELVGVITRTDLLKSFARWP